jgi:hypothetical protein
MNVQMNQNPKCTHLSKCKDAAQMGIFKVEWLEGFSVAQEIKSPHKIAGTHLKNACFRLSTNEGFVLISGQ